MNQTFKPGDRAIVIRSAHKNILGKIVTVLSQQSYLSDSHGVIYPGGKEGRYPTPTGKMCGGVNGNPPNQSSQLVEYTLDKIHWFTSPNRLIKILPDDEAKQLFAEKSKPRELVK